MVSLKKILLGLLVLVLVSILGIFIFTKVRNAQKSNRLQAQNFELTESSPDDFDNEFTVYGQPTFVFSKKIIINETNLSNYFQISPEVKGVWHLEKNGQVVYFAPSDKLDFNTVYKVTIKNSLSSADAKHLENDISVNFRTKQNPEFNFQSDKKLAILAPNERLSLPLSNNDYGYQGKGKLSAGSQIQVIIQPSDEKSLVNYFVSKANKYPVYAYTGTPSNNAKEVTASIESANYGSGIINLDKNVFDTPGIYYLMLKTDFGYDDLFVNVTNHINQAFIDTNNSYLWTTDKTGKSLTNVSLNLYSSLKSVQLVDSVTTDSSGLAKTSKNINNINFVTSHINGDTAITFTNNYGPYGNYTGLDSYQVFSYSDRPVYRPGDLLHYKAVIRKKETSGFSIPNTTFYWRYTSDYVQGKKDYTPVQTDQNGTVSFDVTLPNLESGIYPQIILATKDPSGDYRTIDTYSVNIQSYKKPDMDINAATNEKEYVSKDDSHINVSAKTNYGSPLTNMDFSYRVLITEYSEVKDRSLENIDSTVSSYYGSGDELLTGTGHFDGKGLAQIVINTSLPDKYEKSQIATLEITPNIGAVPSIAKIAKLIHRGEFAIFINSPSADSQNGIKGTFSILDHSTIRQPISGKEASISLYRVYDYNNKQLIETQKTNSDSNGNGSFTFTNTSVGNYEILVQATDGRGNIVSSRYSIYVGSSINQTNQPQYFINLETQKDKYNVGETATVNINTNFPLTDSVFSLTGGGGSTYPATIISLNKNSSNSLNIPVKEDYGDGVGVDVYAVINGQIVSGHVGIGVIKPNKQIKTTITFDKNTYSPGDSVTANIKTVDQNGNPISTDNSLSVIDASILQIGQINGDIYKSFYPETSFNWYTYVVHFDSTTGISRNSGGGGGGCFLSGTQILMADKTAKNIEDVQIGDQIITRIDSKSNHLVVDTVSNTIKHNVTDYLTINNNLNVTWIHRIFLNGEWKEAGDARIGDTLLDSNGQKVIITSIVPHLGNFHVYNLTTKVYHTFFANNIYVHNEKGEGPRENFADTAYWNPHIQTDASGNATLKFKLPDNLTSFTAQVISNSTNSYFGQMTKDLISHKDFNILPVISNFYYQRDTPTIQALVQNSSGKTIDASVSLLVKETNDKKEQNLHIDNADFSTASFPITIGNSNSNLTFLIEAKDNTGKVLDSVQLKKPILPQGNINSAWYSYEGSKSFNYQSTFPNLDFNKVEVTITPNIISQIFHSSHIFTYDKIGISVGQNLYAYSYLVQKTKEGLISPTSYPYAQLKNNIRSAVDTLLQLRTDNNDWVVPQYSTEPYIALNLWLAEGINQANINGNLDGFPNIQQVVSDTKNKYEVNKESNNSDDLIAKQLIKGTVSTNKDFSDSPESVAISSLNSDQTQINKLRSLALSSAQDRLLWNGNTYYSMTLPVLAMVEKGTTQDATRAIKGISVAYANTGYNSLSPLDILAAVKYAERNNWYVDEPSIELNVNSKNIYSADPKTTYSEITKSFSAKNDSSGKINIDLKTQGDVAIYSTFVTSDYGSKANYGDAKIADYNFTKGYKDISNGNNISSIDQGKTGIVDYTITTNFPSNTNLDTTRSNQIYKNTFEAPISPSYLFLQQTPGFNASPQYQSVLAKIFPGSYQGEIKAVVPTDYSDQAAFFQSITAATTYPYVIYNLGIGNYYQPKTNMVFPTLGVISPEK